jgi:DNA-binding transcriptional LysR family regulator
MRQNVNLERVSIFVRIVESGSLSAAAKRVHLSQPALSRNLKLLEEELGVALFSRVGRRLVLTAAGRALQARAPALLASAEGVGLVVSRSAERDYFDVRVGAVDSVITYLFPEVVEHLRTAFPGLALKLTVARSLPLLERIRHNTLDLAVVASSGPPPEIRSRAVGRYELRYYGRADRFPELATAKSMAELDRFPTVQIEAGPGQPVVVPDPALSCAVASNVASVKGLVLAGFGVGDLPDFVLTPEERASLCAARFKLDPDCGLFVAISEAWKGTVEERIEGALTEALAQSLGARRREAPRRRVGR